MVDSISRNPEVLAVPEARGSGASFASQEQGDGASPEFEGISPERIRALGAEAMHAARPAREMKDAMLVQIEQILSEDLAKNYSELSAEEKKIFRERGEDLAREIRKAADGAPLWAHTLLRHMERWLAVLGSHGSPYWLQQEAYMRTRRVLDGVLTAERGH